MTKHVSIIGNWKMYKTAREAVDFIEKVVSLTVGCQAKLFLAVPYTSIAKAAQAAQNTPVAIGAQNMHEERNGAFTGEIASLMLKESGAAFVILGHSERRLLFGENDERIRKKVHRALADDLTPVLCIGETLEQRDARATEEVLQKQLSAALMDVPKEDAAKVMIAYEPIWAIGTGQAATPERVQEAHGLIRSHLHQMFGKHIAHSISILYGGSVKLENAQDLVAKEEVDGLLIGGASLDPSTFAAIANQCNFKKKS